jgi:hypothetical protein
MRVDRGEVQIQELAEGPRPFRALYEHWERHQWSPFEIDFSTDAASFAALDEPTRDGLVLVFSHRFHAEFNVAALLAPFLLAAPDYEVQLLLATQVADEHRHIESVLRVYSDVFAVEGGIAAVKALADEQLDPVAATLYAALDGVVRALEASRDEDSFLKAIVAYHLIGEGSIGRANQTFVAAQFDRVGSFPGLREAQRLAVRGRGAPHRDRCLPRAQTADQRRRTRPGADRRDRRWLPGARGQPARGRGPEFARRFRRRLRRGACDAVGRGAPPATPPSALDRLQPCEGRAAARACGAGGPEGAWRGWLRKG